MIHFRVGQVVRHIHVDTPMIVLSIEPKDIIECGWFEGRGTRSDHFNRADLRHYEAEEQHPDAKAPESMAELLLDRFITALETTPDLVRRLRRVLGL